MNMLPPDPERERLVNEIVELWDQFIPTPQVVETENPAASYVLPIRLHEELLDTLYWQYLKRRTETSDALAFKEGLRFAIRVHMAALQAVNDTRLIL